MFKGQESGTMVLNIVEKELSEQEKTMPKPWLDGCSICINDQIINLNCIKKKLTYRSKYRF